ncbi:hypothetical protein FHS41_005619 [Streptomyces violarus]|uniref:Uncharacterized protein n=1 Tax=Streptomyces violarus TaxID=67380 RepID=A0A7W4ZUR4_9ACTN|nr:hypothetical protein [Streptomyces violarus]
MAFGQGRNVQVNVVEAWAPGLIARVDSASS